MNNIEQDMAHPALENDRAIAGKTNPFRRMWKYRLHYAIVLPALLLVAYFKAIPLLQSLYASFVDFRLIQGFWDSPGAGMANFKHMFDNPDFLPILRNTLQIKLMYTACCGIAALILALAIGAFNGVRSRGAITTLFLLPYFIPSLIFAYMAMLAFSADRSPFGLHAMVWARPELFKPMYLFVEIVKTIGIPTVIAVAAIGARHAADGIEAGRNVQRGTWTRLNLVPAARAVTAFMLMQFSAVLATNFELLHALVNPLVFQTGDTIETYRFRMLFQNMDLNTEGPLATLQFLLQFICSVGAYFIIRRMFARDVRTPHNEEAGRMQAAGRANRAAGGVVILLFALPVLAVLYVLLIYPYTIRNEGPGLSTLLSVSQYVKYLFIYLASSAVFMLITLTLSFPLTVKDLPGRRLYTGFLLAIMSAGSVSFFDFMLLKDLGLINSVVALYITGFFSILPIFVLSSIYTGKHGALRERYAGRGEAFMFFRLYVPRVWKPLLGLGAMQFVAMWNGIYAPMIYISNPNLFPPSMRFMIAQSAMQADGLTYGPATLLQLGALIALPSLVVLLSMRRWLTAEVLAGQVRQL
ncbi:hypothetical protein [Paenibacillus sacheonensis]|uniref:Uncharacterized protein n=1 Tax=Paenibacillus sacheonensis TaxID=742054 RepID=A0A7X4YR87_9BACL|nr:hypothetical protein [Paenibacillus sacheonensis]MBM7563629.1 ABC-type polysaccharide transport system permease subunit [Paenibacillus sacheonensis]NBC71075.1 hypothetical protein [Paenibacillus sacheonensis]